MEQLLVILRDFFETINKEDEKWFTSDSEKDEYCIRSLKGFLEIPASLVVSNTPDALDGILGTIFQAIATRFDNATQKNDFFFFAATHLLYEFFSFGNSAIGTRHRDALGLLLRNLSNYESRLQQEHHPWTVQEPYLWFRNYLWEDPDRYRIGAWSKLLNEYESQLTGSNVFAMSNIMPVS